jgi:hypothetical protein
MKQEVKIYNFFSFRELFKGQMLNFTDALNLRFGSPTTEAANPYAPYGG